MTFETLFGLYYNRYRGEAVIPGTGDDEWKIGIRNYNDAIHRMVAMDDTKWNFLWSTNQTENEADALTTDTEYDAPDGMLEGGGTLTLIDSDDNRKLYPIVPSFQVQSLTRDTLFGWFTGDAQNGFTLHLSMTPNSTEVGMLIEYDVYLTPTLLNPDTEDGSSKVVAGDPAFFYNHMLANRFLNTSNYPSYQVALRDSEEALNNMKLKNNSGTFTRPWNLLDASNDTSRWGM